MSKRNPNAIRSSRGDQVFTVICYVIATLVLLIVAYPLYFVIIASFSDPAQVTLGRVLLLPRGFNIEGYQFILGYKDIWTDYRSTLFYTVAGTLLNLALTLSAGYALSRKVLPGRRVLMGLLTFTMYFTGGMIPTFQVVDSLHLVNKPITMVIMGAVNVYNLIIARTFFQRNIPDELRESAQLDGCNEFNFFWRVVMPLSTAIIAVLTIYYAVAHWNDYMTALLYLRDRKLYPLQTFLREVLILDQFTETQSLMMEKDAIRKQQMLMSMKYGVIIVSSLPVLVLYPFLQKYFVKGVMIGAIKG